MGSSFNSSGNLIRVRQNIGYAAVSKKRSILTHGHYPLCGDKDNGLLGRDGYPTITCKDVTGTTPIDSVRLQVDMRTQRGLAKYRALLPTVSLIPLPPSELARARHSKANAQEKRENKQVLASTQSSSEDEDNGDTNLHEDSLWDSDLEKQGHEEQLDAEEASELANPALSNLLPDPQRWQKLFQAVTATDSDGPLSIRDPGMNYYMSRENIVGQTSSSFPHSSLPFNAAQISNQQVPPLGKQSLRSSDRLSVPRSNPILRLRSEHRKSAILGTFSELLVDSTLPCEIPLVPQKPRLNLHYSADDVEEQHKQISKTQEKRKLYLAKEINQTETQLERMVEHYTQPVIDGAHRVLMSIAISLAPSTVESSTSSSIINNLSAVSPVTSPTFNPLQEKVASLEAEVERLKRELNRSNAAITKATISDYRASEGGFSAVNAEKDTTIKTLSEQRRVLVHASTSTIAAVKKHIETSASTVAFVDKIQGNLDKVVRILKADEVKGAGMSKENLAKICNLLKSEATNSRAGTSLGQVQGSLEDLGKEYQELLNTISSKLPTNMKALLNGEVGLELHNGVYLATALALEHDLEDTIPLRDESPVKTENRPRRTRSQRPLAQSIPEDAEFCYIDIGDD